MSSVMDEDILDLDLGAPEEYDPEVPEGDETSHPLNYVKGNLQVIITPECKMVTTTSGTSEFVPRVTHGKVFGGQGSGNSVMSRTNVLPSLAQETFSSSVDPLPNPGVTGEGSCLAKEIKDEPTCKDEELAFSPPSESSFSKARHEAHFTRNYSVHEVAEQKVKHEPSTDQPVEHMETSARVKSKGSLGGPVVRSKAGGDNREDGEESRDSSDDSSSSSGESAGGHWSESSRSSKGSKGSKNKDKDKKRQKKILPPAIVFDRDHSKERSGPKKPKSCKDDSRLEFFFDHARYFIIKSGNSENVSLSKAKGVWATTPRNENVLNRAFRETKNVILVFSVERSQAFQGFCRLAAESTRNCSPVSWVLPPGMSNRSLGGVFKVHWINRNELPFFRTASLINPWNENKPVRIARDGTEIAPVVGRELCQAFPIDDGIDLERLLEKVKKMHSEHSLLHKSSQHRFSAMRRSNAKSDERVSGRGIAAREETYSSRRDGRNDERIDGGRTQSSARSRDPRGGRSGHGGSSGWGGVSKDTILNGDYMDYVQEYHRSYQPGYGPPGAYPSHEVGPEPYDQGYGSSMSSYGYAGFPNSTSQVAPPSRSARSGPSHGAIRESLQMPAPPAPKSRSGGAAQSSRSSNRGKRARHASTDSESSGNGRSPYGRSSHQRASKRYVSGENMESTSSRKSQHNPHSSSRYSASSRGESGGKRYAGGGSSSSSRPSHYSRH